MDLLYIGIAAAFFAATWGLLKLCEHLLNYNNGPKQ